MTSFQRLLKGLQTLNRYSGITDVRLSEVGDGWVEIPVPSSIVVDTSTQAALAKLGWIRDDNAWVFTP